MHHNSERYKLMSLVERRSDKSVAAGKGRSSMGRAGEKRVTLEVAYVREKRKPRRHQQKMLPRNMQLRYPA